MKVLLVLPILLFVVGLIGLFVRRRLVLVVICMQLMMMSVALLLALLSKTVGNIEGQVFSIFVIFLSFIMAILGLGLGNSLFRKEGPIEMEEIVIQEE